MKRSNYFKIVFAALVLTACGGSAPAPEPVMPDAIEEAPEKPATEITWESLTTATPGDGDLIIIEGYIGDMGSYVSEINGQYNVPVYPRRFQDAGLSLGVYVTVGTGTNMVASLPDNFVPADYKIYCDDSTIVTLGDKVRVTVEMYAATMKDYYSGDVVKIEAIEDNFDATQFDAAVPLTEAMVSDTSDALIYCYVTGKLALPSFIYSLDNTISLDLNNSSVKSISSVSIRVDDDGPSSMSDIPDNFTSKDLVVRDYAGEVIPNGSTVRVYGTWSKSASYGDEKLVLFTPEEISKN